MKLESLMDRRLSDDHVVWLTRLRLTTACLSRLNLIHNKVVFYRKATIMHKSQHYFSQCLEAASKVCTHVIFTTIYQSTLVRVPDELQSGSDSRERGQDHLCRTQPSPDPLRRQPRTYAWPPQARLDARGDACHFQRDGHVAFVQAASSSQPARYDGGQTTAVF